MKSLSSTTSKKLSGSSAKDWKPRRHQELTVRFFVSRGGAGALQDPGLGKTSSSLAAFKILRKKKLAKRALVIAPVRPCYLVWPKEIEKWNDFKHFKYEILHGDDKNAAAERPADIYIINPEGLPWFVKNKIWKKIKADVLIVDESSKFKHTKTRRFKSLRKILKHFLRRWILTGSPAPNGLMDLFGQVFLLDFGAALGQFITHYRMSYFSPTGWQGMKWKINDGAEKLIFKQIKHLIIAMKAEDYLDMPKLIEDPIYIDLPKDARRLYDEMEQDLVADMKQGAITAVSAAVATSKCSQIANGFLYDENKKAHPIHELKGEAVQDLVDELGGSPALINFEFEQDRKMLLKFLGKDTPDLGRVKLSQVRQMEAAWNRGDIPVMIGSAAAIGHGLNLQESGYHVIVPSLIWNFEHYDQFIRRIRRDGQKSKRVIVHPIIARGTIDEIKWARLRQKERLQNSVFEALKTYIRTKKPLKHAKV
jgi:SNF2 family DNA or RNA helicase